MEAVDDACKALILRLHRGQLPQKVMEELAAFPPPNFKAKVQVCCLSTDQVTLISSLSGIELEHQRPPLQYACIVHTYMVQLCICACTCEACSSVFMAHIGIICMLVPPRLKHWCLFASPVPLLMQPD